MASYFITKLGPKEEKEKFRKSEDIFIASSLFA